MKTWKGIKYFFMNEKKIVHVTMTLLKYFTLSVAVIPSFTLTQHSPSTVSHFTPGKVELLTQIECQEVN